MSLSTRLSSPPPQDVPGLPETDQPQFNGGGASSIRRKPDLFIRADTPPRKTELHIDGYIVIVRVRPLELVEVLPPRRPIIEDYTDPNPESVSTEDVVHNKNNEDVSTETCSDVDQQKGKNQEEAISGQDNGTMQDVKDQLRDQWTRQWHQAKR
ncbi:hypothetical protein DY000_02051270 [Brassica cretica]|uniref:Uncharacterized protein n=1 Tax=Brassica cretica TaxID=69181 RepID=A0ABQ7F2C8_BRACR|nr:hypothetical protein DY000_02051270 [Brassica cretica]